MSVIKIGFQHEFEQCAACQHAIELTSTGVFKNHRRLITRPVFGQTIEEVSEQCPGSFKLPDEVVKIAKQAPSKLKAQATAPKAKPKPKTKPVYQRRAKRRAPRR